MLARTNTIEVTEKQIWIPADIWLLILAMLNPKDLLNISLVCAGLHYLADKDDLWKSHLLKKGREVKTHGLLKFQFFNIDHMMTIYEEHIIPIIKAILEHKEKLRVEDIKFIKMIGNKSPKHTPAPFINKSPSLLKQQRDPLRDETTMTQHFFAQNLKLLCVEFISIPYVLNHLYRLTRKNLFSRSLDAVFANDTLDGDNHRYSENHQFRTLLLCILIAAHDEKKFGSGLSEFYIAENFGFAQIAHTNHIVSSPIKCAQDLFALARLYLQKKHAQIEPVLIQQFYACCIGFLTSQDTDHPLIPVLVEEQARYLDLPSAKLPIYSSTA